jgi:hypothetical protein
MEFSCDHVMYSQQDPLILDFSSSSDNADVTSSQVIMNKNVCSHSNHISQSKKRFYDSD